MARCYQPRDDPAIRPLTPLSCPVFALPCGRAISKHQDHLRCPRVNADSFLDPRRLPSTSTPSPLSRREPATILTALPPRAGFQRSFAPVYALARLGARPSTVVTGYSPVIVSDRALLVNFCNRNDTRAQPLDRPNPTSVPRVSIGYCAPRFVGRKRSTYVSTPRVSSLASGRSLRL